MLAVSDATGEPVAVTEPLPETVGAADHDADIVPVAVFVRDAVEVALGVLGTGIIIILYSVCP